MSTQTPPYYEHLAAAYVRGRLLEAPDPPAEAAELLVAPLEALETPALERLIALGAAQGLRLHRFKRTMGLARVRRVLGALQALAPQELLDIGSGRGAFLWPLLDAMPGLPVTAVDTLDYRVADLLAVRRGGRIGATPRWGRRPWSRSSNTRAPSTSKARASSSAMRTSP